MTGAAKRALVALALVGAAAGRAGAEPVVLRIGSVAPDGTAWAKLLRAYSAEVEAATDGQLKLKFYFGGVTGDELETLEAVKRGHLDGIGSGGIACERLAPSMRVQGLPGVFQSRAESAWVFDRLRPTLEAEAARAGFALLAVTGIGPEVIFSRMPIRNVAELLRLRLWRWRPDEVGITVAKAMHMNVVALELPDAGPAFDSGQIDGFLAIPSAALAFQWSTQARYITDLRVGYLNGCVAIKQEAFDRIPVAYQQKMRALMAKYIYRFDDTGARQDEALLSGLFERQGLRNVPVSESFRAEFFELARTARERSGRELVPRALLDTVIGMLADYRAEHVRR